MHDIRWQQRFANYQKALALLQNAVAIPQPDITQQAGLIQFFEISFELSWKLLKDYLEQQGYAGINSPRSAIKQAFVMGVIHNGHTWLYMLENRNQTTHTYDEAEVTEITQKIREHYLPLFVQLETAFMAIRTN